MGYTTEFRGVFELDRELDDETFKLLRGLAKTRRMARDVGSEFGVEGEFYINNDGNFGQTRESNIIDYNQPPKTQPGLWLQWTPTDDRKFIKWDGKEKFYNYVEWLEYLIAKILKPRGYKLNGEVEFRGEEWDDRGFIVVEDNEVTTQ